jgi:hypothetical protein
MMERFALAPPLVKRLRMYYTSFSASYSTDTWQGQYVLPGLNEAFASVL